MVSHDLDYIRLLLGDGIIASPCLEAGAGLECHTLKPLLNDAGVEWFGTDLQTSNDALFAVNLEHSFEDMNAALAGKRFSTVLLLNVIEHVFDPIRVLDNVCKLLNDGGHCVVVAPTVWSLHYYPLDCWRINPNFFEEYCKRRGVQLLEKYFFYVSPYNRAIDRDTNGQPVLPPPTEDKVQYWKSRAVHKIFDTYARGMATPPRVSTGAVIRV
jgi:SAM-dependent methyltransferase